MCSFDNATSKRQKGSKTLYISYLAVLKTLIVVLRRSERYLDFVRSLDTSFSYIKTRDKMYANERQEILLVLQLSLVFSFVGIQKLDL